VIDRRLAGLVSAGLLIGALGLAAAAPVTAKWHVDALLDGLSSPKGIAIAANGDVAVGQGTFGPPGPVLAYHRTGPARGTADAIFDPIGLVDIAAAPDGSGWAIGGDGWLYHVDIAGTVEPVLDIIAYQGVDIDPYNNPLEDPAESNPYGLAALPNGDALVADAAGNDILRVTPSGDVTTVARFTRRTVSTDHIPGFPVPTIDAEAVPTSVTIGPDGWAYVGQLMGFPFRPGTSNVWRIDPGAEDAVCTAGAPSADCSVWKSGFTGIEDIAFNPNNGALYVLELAEGGVLPSRKEFATAIPPAVLLEVRGSRRIELAPASSPSGRRDRP
jgi:hypothetical protein